MNTPQGYALLAHGEMITDGPRIAAYSQALRDAIRPGTTVLDLGAGTGIFSLLACRFGAEHVYAIEPDDILNVARELAAANGYSDRITFYQELSTAAHLPSRVDVVVSDLRGVLPLFETHIPAIIDARQRFLADGGRLIPQLDTMWVALAGGPEIDRPLREPWLENEFGLDLSAAHPFVSNVWRRVSLDREHLLCPAQRWATLDYRTIDRPHISGEVAWTLDRGATAHGLAVWFDATLDEGIGFSNAPGETKLIYGQTFFPWPTPLEVAAGDRVSVRLRADLAGHDYIWRWCSEIRSGRDSRRVKASFDQSTFFANPVSPELLRRREANFTPELDVDGQVDAFMLSLIDGNTSLEKIARRAADRFPGRFKGWKEALTRVAELAAKYAR